MGSRGVIALVLVLVVAPLSSAAGSGLAADGAARQTSQETIADRQVNPDTVLLTADVTADGTATWEIEYLVLLDDRNASDAFDDLAREIEANSSTYASRFEERMGRTVADAENRTGREMALRNVSVATERQDLGQEYGVVRYRFTWVGFAAANETAIEVGDALGGFYLDGQTQLTISWPAEYRLASVSPEPTERRDRAVVWNGRLEFGERGPQLVLTEQPPRDASSGALPLVLAALFGVGLLAGVGWIARRRGLLGTGGPGTGDAPGDDDAAGTTAAGDGDDPPAELLSNEERVLRLLETEGGRIKQKEVAERLDWTAAKTSQVVKGLREDDELDVFRLGRENVLTLPDEDDT